MDCASKTTNFLDLEKLSKELERFNELVNYMKYHGIELKNTPSQKNYKRVYKTNEREDKEVKGGCRGYRKIKKIRKGKSNNKIE